FHFASSFLPKPKRGAVHAVAAFCLLTADAMRDNGESCAPAVSGACCGPDDALLAMFRERIDDLYAGRVDRSAPASEDRMVLIAMTSTTAAHQIPRELFFEFAEGVRNDSGLKRFATWESLERHIHRTYGALCRIIACVLGVSHSDGQRFANELAGALALTRVISTVTDDWKRGTLYLPLVDLAKANCTERDVARASGGERNEAFDRVIEIQRTRARERYRLAGQNIAWLADDGSRMMGALIIVSGLAQLDGKRLPILRRILSAWRLARGAIDGTLRGFLRN
ncbi:MAG TPA: squalene/phytoene synthase family protein, partial [Tepidisphaeraceae bacterium]|nr:squalene/phytoene synthase family protein [Tepidisphaeraceae bacterium]